MAYADYAFYTGEFRGTAIPAEEFPALAERASETIDHLTLGRAADSGPVRRACCAVAEQLRENALRGDVASESNDGASISYRENGRSPQARLYDAAARYLARTGLLYRGVG